MKDLLDLTIEEMKEFAAELGEKPYRGKQLFQWVHKGADFSEMTDLPKAFREQLQHTAVTDNVKIAEVQEDGSDGTRKFLFEIAGHADAETAPKGEAAGGDTPKKGPDGDDPAPGYVEAVVMKYRYGNTICISSQIGCRMGCVFCASALGGFIRDLTAGEMAGQIIAAEKIMAEKIDHIVVMGMGEPFDNYENLSRFIRIIHDPEGRNLSHRNITVSTSGIIPKISSFAEDFPQVNLAISLHRVSDDKRSEIMPVNRKYHLEDLIEAAKKYTEKTRRRITFEYALIEGENDGDEDARQMIRLLRGMLCHVNLIPLNRVDDIGLEGSSRRRAKEFAKMLTDGGIPATVRRQLGDEIDGACGQLRLKKA